MVTERKRLAKKHGVTGKFILYRLNDLCQFDPVSHLVVDIMHSVVLNLICSELEHHLGEMGPNAGTPISERSPGLGAVLS